MVRAITTDPTSTASQYLTSLGAELYTSSPVSSEQLAIAFKGANAVFSQTPHGVAEAFELEAALTQARAASSADADTFIFSSLEDVSARSHVNGFRG